TGPTGKPSGVTEVVEVGDAEVSEGASGAGTAAPEAPATPPTPRIRLRISLPALEPGPAHTVRAHPDMAAAAQWFLAHNTPRRLSGFAAVKERTRYRCENPECERRTLRVEAHHIHWRQHGGNDDP